MLSGHSVGTYQETSMHATCQGNTWPQSSQLAEPLWTDPGFESGIGVRELISTHTHIHTLTHTHKHARTHTHTQSADENESSLSPKTLAREEKATSPTSSLGGVLSPVSH